MEHTNLFLYESEADFLTDYPGGKMDHPVPGVAYNRGAEGELGTLHTNREVTTYEITIHSTNKSGETVAPDKVIETNPVLDGNTVKMNVVADPVEGYKPRHEVEKVTFTSASTEHTIVYLAPASYTVTVNYVCSGESIAPSSAVVIDNIFDEDIVRLRIEPVTVAGYSASPVTISVSGSMTYNLEYEVSGPTYEFVDLGLTSGTLWATCNIGASSPEEYGDYFAWGELNSKPTYTVDNYRFSDGQGGYTKYSGTTWLEREDDVVAVTINDGEAHMPTYDQLNELINQTDTAWTSINGVYGLQVTATGSSGSGERSLPSIFFPAAGAMNGDEAFGVNQTVFVYSCGLYEDAVDTFMASEDGRAQMIEGNDAPPRYIGLPARAVKDGDSPEPGPDPQPNL